MSDPVHLTNTGWQLPRVSVPAETFSFYALSTNPLHGTVTYFNCIKSLSVLCLLIVGEAVLFSSIFNFGSQHLIAVLLVHFTVVFDQHEKTLAWEQQQLTNGGEYDSDHVCFNTDPGHSHCAAFHVLDYPLLYNKRRFKKQERGVGIKRGRE